MLGLRALRLDLRGEAIRLKPTVRPSEYIPRRQDRKLIGIYRGGRRTCPGWQLKPEGEPVFFKGQLGPVGGQVGLIWASEAAVLSPMLEYCGLDRTRQT